MPHPWTVYEQATCILSPLGWPWVSSFPWRAAWQGSLKTYKRDCWASYWSGSESLRGFGLIFAGWEGACRATERSKAFRSLEPPPSSFFLALLWRPVLRYQMGITAEPLLIALLLGTLATTLRMPDRIFYARSPLATPAVENSPAGPFITNAAGMTLLTILYPYCSGVTVVELGPFTLVASGSFWALYACVGILLGLLLTFIFGTFQDDILCTIIATGTVATVGGLCIGKAIPGVVVGFISGVWFINTTTRRRDALELLEKTTGILQPVFFLVVGCLLATQNLTVLRLTAFAFLFLVAPKSGEGYQPDGCRPPDPLPPHTH